MRREKKQTHWRCFGAEQLNVTFYVVFCTNRMTEAVAPWLNQQEEIGLVGPQPIIPVGKSSLCHATLKGQYVLFSIVRLWGDKWKIITSHVLTVCEFQILSIFLFMQPFWPRFWVCAHIPPRKNHTPIFFFYGNPDSRKQTGCALRSPCGFTLEGAAEHPHEMTQRDPSASVSTPG